LRWNGQEHSLGVTGCKPTYVPDEASAEHFFKEHRWGFGQDRRGRTIRYEVQHPVWEVYAVQSFELTLDWSVYGPEWKFLQERRPDSVILCAGSAITLYPKGRL
jgi:hypothetical protein